MVDSNERVGSWVAGGWDSVTDFLDRPGDRSMSTMKLEVMGTILQNLAQVLVIT